MYSKDDKVDLSYLVPGKLYRDLSFGARQNEILLYLGAMTEENERYYPSIRAINNVSPITEFCGFLKPNGKLLSFHKESEFARDIRLQVKRIL